MSPLHGDVKTSITQSRQEGEHKMRADIKRRRPQGPWPQQSSIACLSEACGFSSHDPRELLVAY